MPRLAVICFAAMGALGLLASELKAEVRVGSWTVGVRHDDFSDHAIVVASTVSEDLDAQFAVRCWGKDLSMFVHDSVDEIDKGQTVPIKARFDRGEIIDIIGEAGNSDGTVIAHVEKYFVQQLLTAKRLATRLVLDTSIRDFRFELDGTEAALARIVKDCDVRDEESPRTAR